MGPGRLPAAFTQVAERVCKRQNSKSVNSLAQPVLPTSVLTGYILAGKAYQSSPLSKHFLFPPKTLSKKEHWAGKKGCSSKLRSGFSDEAGRRRRLTGQLSPAFVTGVVELAGAGCYRTCKPTDALKLFAIQTNTCEEPSGREVSSEGHCRRYCWLQPKNGEKVATSPVGSP